MFEKVASKFVVGIGIVILLLINVVNLTFYNQGYWPIHLSIIVKVGLSFAFVVATLIGLFILRLVYHATNPYWLIAILVIAFVLRVSWVLVAKTPPTQDYLQLHNASLAFAAGRRNFVTGSAYVTFAPFMVGFVIYQGVLIKIFGDSLIVLQLFNCIFSTLTIYFVWRIGNFVFGEKAGILAAVIMALYLPNIVVVSILTNDVLATCLFMAGIDAVVEHPTDIRYLTLAGVAIYAGNLIRPLASIIIIAILLYEICLVCPQLKQANQKKSLITGLAALVLCFGIFTAGTNQALLSSKMTNQSIVSTITSWKFAEGLNNSTTGKWSAADYRYVTAVKSPTQREQRAATLVKARIQNPVQVAKLMARKFAVMWGDLDTMISWGTKHTSLSPMLIALLAATQKVMYMCIIVLATLAIFKKMPTSALLLVILLIGYVLIHLGIEIQTRYRYFLMPVLILLASGGMSFSLRNHITGNDSLSQ